MNHLFISLWNVVRQTDNTLHDNNVLRFVFTDSAVLGTTGYRMMING